MSDNVETSRTSSLDSYIIEGLISVEEEERHEAARELPDGLSELEIRNIGTQVIELSNQTDIRKPKGVNVIPDTLYEIAMVRLYQDRDFTTAINTARVLRRTRLRELVSHYALRYTIRQEKRLLIKEFNQFLEQTNPSDF